MSVLVTGGAGYIGSHMVWELLDHGEKVVVLDRLSTGFDWAVPPEAPLVVGDVGDSELVASIIREHEVDAIIHFAGSLIVSGIGLRSARLLREQHLQDAQPDRDGGAREGAALHLLLDRGRLRHGRHRAGARGRRDWRPNRPTAVQADDRMDAARRGRRA